MVFCLIFDDRIALHGVESSTFVPIIGPRARPSMEEDFISLYPRKKIAELQATTEDGVFIVFGVIDGFVEGEEWWYPACRCQ